MGKIFFLLILLLPLLGFFILGKKESKPIEQIATPSLEPEEKVYPPHPDTIPLMAKKEYLGSDLKLGRVLSQNETYTRYAVTYLSEGFQISGIVNIPNGKGPFPVLFLNHGYIDPTRYTIGAGLKREQDFFARHGYAVFHTDYRNHAESDFDPGNEVRPRSGYVEDVLNAVSALKKAGLENIDSEKIGMLGHSMGGGVTLNVMVTKPETAKVYALLAPIHADYKVNFDKWVVTEWPETAEEFFRTYYTYEENPQFWHDVSAINFFSRISAPVILHQGTADREVPVEWSRELAEKLKAAGKDIIYHEYPDEPHVFEEAQKLVMTRTLEFFDAALKTP